MIIKTGKINKSRGNISLTIGKEDVKKHNLEEGDFVILTPQEYEELKTSSEIEVSTLEVVPDDEAVVKLGVGKNMVASIKFWMKAFGLLDQDLKLTQLSKNLLDNTGYDPFIEDIGSLWLMHYNIIKENYATAYRATFVDYHSQRNTIEKNKLLNFIKHFCFDNASYRNLYNENTVKKDLSVLIHNYYTSGSGVEDSNTIFAPLNLIREVDDGAYQFNYDSRTRVPDDIFLYALLVSFSENKSISFESMKELSLIFCITNNCSSFYFIII